MVCLPFVHLFGNLLQGEPADDGVLGEGSRI